MRISDIIKTNVSEDASVGATGAASVASVAFPLFGSPDQVRKAVDPNGYLGGKKKKKPPVIKRMMEKMDAAQSAAIPGLMDIGDNGKDLNDWGKAVAGHDGKKQTAPKNSSAGTFKDHGYAVGYTDVERKMASKAISKKTKHMTSPKSGEPKGTNTKSVFSGDMREAAEDSLFSNDVIYRLDPENPMDDSEILVIGGAGRYSFKGLREKARREAAQLAKDIQGDHGQDFRGASHNIKQLSNTLRTIVAAYDQLNAMRAKGGTKSRGIRNEDQALIKESLTLIKQWSTKANKVKS
jgi:hypothetical protein